MTTYEWAGLVATGVGMVLGYLVGRADRCQLGVTQEVLRELSKPDVFRGTAVVRSALLDLVDLNPEAVEIVVRYMRGPRENETLPALDPETAEAVILREQFRERWGYIWRDLERAEASTELVRQRGSPEAQALRLAEQVVQCRKGDDRDVYPDW